MNTKEITNSEDVIDSRSIIERIKYLEIGEDNQDEEEQAELKTLKEMQEEAEGYSSDWQHGATLIRDSYFAEYAQELCEDIGDIPKSLPSYIASHIDWDGVADEIKTDYNSVSFDGVDYWIRVD